MLRFLNVEILIVATDIASTLLSRLTDLMGISSVYIRLCIYVCVYVHVWLYEILSHV